MSEITLQVTVDASDPKKPTAIVADLEVAIDARPLAITWQMVSAGWKFTGFGWKRPGPNRKIFGPASVFDGWVTITDSHADHSSDGGPWYYKLRVAPLPKEGRVRKSTNPGTIVTGGSGTPNIKNN